MKNIKLQGIKNIRDLGNIQTKYGKIRKGALLRASALNRLTGKDLDRLKKWLKVQRKGEQCEKIICNIISSYYVFQYCWL